jgi:electron transport complex protein RnfE
MSNKNSKISILTNGILKENPVLRLVLGTCPTLAVTTMASNGIGMGLAATFVLLCSNVVISALRNVIPGQVRIPCYITVIAGFVSVVQMLVKAFVPSLDSALGVYLPLIVVNCIILGRAEMFASKNGILDSALDGIGMGLGFTLTLTVMGSIREILGAGTWMSGLDGLLPFLPEGFKIQVLPSSVDPFTLMTSAPGGFFVFGVLMAAAVYLTTPKAKKDKKEQPAETVEGGNA